MTTHLSAPTIANIAAPSIYPAYLHPLSPTYFQWVRLTAADVHKLDAHSGFVEQGIYHYKNHPIRFVRLVGVIVAVDEWERRWVLQLDDSSGQTIEIVVERPKKPPDAALDQLGKSNEVEGAAHHHGDLKEQDELDLVKRLRVDVGSVVKAKGTIGHFRGMRQMLCKRMAIVPDTNAEVHAWREQTTFHHEILQYHWHVSPEDQQRMLEETIQKQKRAEDKERRRKAKLERHEARLKSRDLAERLLKRSRNGQKGDSGERRNMSVAVTSAFEEQGGIWDDEITERKEILESGRAIKTRRSKKDSNKHRLN